MGTWSNGNNLGAGRLLCRVVLSSASGMMKLGLDEFLCFGRQSYLHRASEYHSSSNDGKIKLYYERVNVNIL